MLKLYGHDTSLFNCSGMSVHVYKIIVDIPISSFMTYYTNTTIDSTRGAGQCLHFQSHWGYSTSNVLCSGLLIIGFLLSVFFFGYSIVFTSSNSDFWLAFFCLDMFI